MHDTLRENACKVSVVIVNWNTRDYLATALSSLHKATTGPSFETIVVDNGSSDGSAEFVARTWTNVRLVTTPVNVGFAAGNNLGFKECRGEHVLLLNSDTIVLPSTLSGMADFLDTHPETGCVGCRHLNPDQTLQGSIGHFPSLLEDFIAYTELERLPSLQPFLSKRFAYWGSYDRVREVDWVTGSCFMVRREVLNRIGGLDESYFIYAEELDWCFRMRQAGWNVHFTPQAEVIHFGGQAMNRVPEDRIVLKLTSQYRFYRRFYSTWRCLVWRIMVALVALVRLMLLVCVSISLLVRPNASTPRRWLTFLARESVISSPRAALRAWMRILLFCAYPGPIRATDAPASKLDHRGAETIQSG